MTAWEEFLKVLNVYSFCMWTSCCFLYMLTNDEPKGKLLFITDAKQNKNNTNCGNCICWQHRKTGSLKCVNYRKTHFAICVIVYFKIGLISIFKNKTFFFLFHWERAPINRSINSNLHNNNSLGIRQTWPLFFL
jgi:hypothetical protein